MSQFQMQAKSSTSGALVSWLSDTADFAGMGFPGPGLPSYVAVAAHLNKVEPGAGTPAGPTNSVQYNGGSGEFEGATNVKVGADLTSLTFGGTPATAGASLRFTKNVTLASVRNAADSGNLAIVTSDNADGLTLGDASVAGWTLNLKTGGTYSFQVNGTTEFSLSSSVADFKDNVAQFGTNPSGSGLIRGPNGVVFLSGRNVLNTGDIDLVRLDNVDKVFVGEGTNTAGVVLSLKTGGTGDIRIANTTEYSFGAAAADFKLNDLTNVASLNLVPQAAGPGAGATQQAININSQNYAGLAGSIRVINVTSTGTFSQVAGAYTTASLMRLRQCVIAGDSATAAFSGITAALAIQGAPTQGTNATLANSVAVWLEQDAAALAMGAVPSTAGTLRFAKNLTLAAVRNAANSGNVSILTSDNADGLALGDSNVAGWTLNLKTGGSYAFQVNGTSVYSLSSTIADFKALAAQFGTNPSGSGLIRFPNNSVVLSGRNAANSADVQLLKLNSTNDFIVGDGTNGSFIYLNTASTVAIQIATTNEYVFTSTIADFKDNVLQFGTNPAGTGTIRLPPDTGAVYARNHANTSDLPLARMLSSDIYVLGGGTEGVAGVQLETTTGSIKLKIATVDNYVFDGGKVFVANSNSVPSTDPSGGGVLYVESGSLKFRGSSGTVTTLAAA